jgi:hypothetical protein
VTACALLESSDADSRDADLDDDYRMPAFTHVNSRVPAGVLDQVLEDSKRYALEVSGAPFGHRAKGSRLLCSLPVCCDI